MEPLDSSVAVPASKDEWKSAGTMNGLQCVMISGPTLMLWLLAGSWDT